MNWRGDVGTVREALFSPNAKLGHAERGDGAAALARLEERLERYETALRAILPNDALEHVESAPAEVRAVPPAPDPRLIKRLGPWGETL